MHELPITQSLLDLALEHAEGAGGGRITSLNLVIGQLSGVVPDSVQFYWDFISRDTPAEGAVLNIRRVAVALECRACERTFSPSGEDFRCPWCRGADVQVSSGDEFYLESLDLEPEEVPSNR